MPGTDGLVPQMPTVSGTAPPTTLPEDQHRESRADKMSKQNNQAEPSTGGQVDQEIQAELEDNARRRGAVTAALERIVEKLCSRGQQATIQTDLDLATITVELSHSKDGRETVPQFDPDDAWGGTYATSRPAETASVVEAQGGARAGSGGEAADRRS